MARGSYNFPVAADAEVLLSGKEAVYKLLRLPSRKDNWSKKCFSENVNEKKKHVKASRHMKNMLTTINHREVQSGSVRHHTPVRIKMSWQGHDEM